MQQQQQQRTTEKEDKLIRNVDISGVRVGGDDDRFSGDVLQ